MTLREEIAADLDVGPHTVLMDQVMAIIARHWRSRLDREALARVIREAEGHFTGCVCCPRAAAAVIAHVTGEAT